MNLLTEAVVRCVDRGGRETRATLPGVLALLAQDGIMTFSALRTHQRHAWHAFLCQIACLSMVRAGAGEPWTEEAEWREALRGLAPGHPDDAPWCLVTPPDRPALLQPPVPDGIGALRNQVDTPDALDMLVTSRNHDLKRAVMSDAAPDDWLFALVSLQTMEGFLGAGNYGISRMNGGFGSRPALGIAPAGGPGAHWRRDTRRLLALRGTTASSRHYAARDGLALLWLEPWDGTTSLRVERLDEFYVEICRRVRLVDDGGHLSARVGGSRAGRVETTPGGLTGDPWAPVVPDKDGLKVLTMPAGGFTYRRMVGLIWPENGVPAPLQRIDASDDTAGLVLVARALVRGQGKTEGYHERHVPVSQFIKRMTTTATDPAAEAAARRVRLAGAMGRVLKQALLALFQGGPDKIDERDKDANRKAQRFLDRLDDGIDREFFAELGREVEAGEIDPESGEAVLRDWVHHLLRRAEAVLADADKSAPKASRRRLRARVASQVVLHGFARRNQELQPYLLRETKDAA